MSLSLPNDEIDKALSLLVYEHMRDELGKIGWEFPGGFVKSPVKATMRNCNWSDEAQIQAFMELANNKVLCSETRISRMSLLIRGNEELLRWTQVASKDIAWHLIEALMKEYKTTYNEERKKFFEDRYAKMSQRTSFSGISIVASPAVPSGEVRLVNANGEVVRVTGINFDDEKLDKPATIKDAVEERKKVAKWKIE